VIGGLVGAKLLWTLEFSAELLSAGVIIAAFLIIGRSGVLSASRPKIPR
jgi:hypothetical protein